MDHAARSVKSKMLNCWNTVLTAQMVKLTYYVIEIFLRKRVLQQRGSSGTVQARLRPRPTHSASASKMRNFRADE